MARQSVRGDRWPRHLHRELGVTTEPVSSLHMGLEVISVHLYPELSCVHALPPQSWDRV